jgi:cell division protein FtsB
MSCPRCRCIVLVLNEQDNKKLKTLNDQLTRQVEQLSRDIAARAEEFEKLSEEKDDMETEIAEMDQKIENYLDQIATQDQEIKKLSEEKRCMKTLIEQLTQQVECSIQTIAMGEKKTSGLSEEIEKLKMKNKSATLDDFATLLRNNLSEIHSHLEYHVNFDEICSKPLAILSRDTRFVEALSKDISEQVLRVVQGKADEKKNIETCVVQREKKRSEIIQIIQTLSTSLKQEQDKITSIQHLLIFDNKLDSKKLDELCSMRSKLIEMDKELELRLLTIPKHFEECNHKIDKTLQFKKELEAKDEELDRLEGTIKTQFKKNTPEYKLQMSKLESQRNAWRQDGVKLEISKQEMINELIHYPELRFKLEEDGEFSDDPYQFFKNYLKSVNLFVDLNPKDHFSARKNFKESLHLLNCTNLQGEPKFLKKLVVSNPKTLTPDTYILKR